jgi:ferredoxin
MKIYVDPSKCRSRGECVRICPDVFRFHEGSKKAYASLDPVPPELFGACLNAAKACPEKAIVLSE